MSRRERRGFLDVVGPATRLELQARARIVRARRHQAILSRGESAGDVFIVQEGRLQVTLYAANGREVRLRELNEGQLFGELAAIDGEARSVAIVAAADARLLAIPQAAFRHAIESDPEASQWLIHRLVTQVRSLTDRVFEVSALNVRARLHCELMRLARSDHPSTPTHAELANRIGANRESVTRELKMLADRKILRSGRGRLELLDMGRLEAEVQSSLRAPLGEAGWW